MRRSVKIALAAAATVALAAEGYVSRRDKAMEALYKEAAGYPPFFRSTVESPEAVRKLGSYRGQRATEMLLAIAVGHEWFGWGGVQSEAVKQLARRNDPRVAPALARLLQPHEDLNTREGVAAGLLEMPCGADCAASVLHYLERVQRGDPNDEDRIVDPSYVPKDAAARTRKEQQALYATLYAILKRNEWATLTNLGQVYGLGSEDPSLFALDLVSRAQLARACGLLLQSEREIEKMSPESYKAPREELRAAIASLKCR